MNTAQRVLSGGAAIQEQKNIVPWIVGGLVLVVVVYLIAKIL